MAGGTWKPPAEGDLLWQLRMPGGVCVFVEEINIVESGMGWGECDEPIWLVLHPEEGLIQDPSYYYNTLEMEIKRAVRTSRGGKKE